MNRTLLALVALTQLGCGQTSRDADSGTGGSGGSAGASAMKVECSGAHWTRFAPPHGATQRGGHMAAAWGMDQVIIWGGGSETGAVVSGWRVFADGSVMALPESGAPSPRGDPAFDIIGDRLLVWGGTLVGAVGDGAWLDLTNNRWTPLPSADLLGAREGPFSGVVGKRWLVWGGGTSQGLFASGAFYDPDLDAWIALGEDAPVASLHDSGSALASGGPDVGPAVFGLIGGEAPTDWRYGYAPKSAAWWTMPSDGAPSSRGGASLTWSISTQEFVVWGGGHDLVELSDGARLSLATQTWKQMSTSGAPSPRVGHDAVMLGQKLVIYGGRDYPSGSANYLADGGIYDVGTDTWESLPLDECAPTSRGSYTFTAFGNGRQVLLWGGAPPRRERYSA